MTATGILSVRVPTAAHAADTTVPGVTGVVAVVFDVGETLVDETRIWSRWADRLGVTRLTMLGAIGAMAALDRPQADAFGIVRPGLDLDAEITAWAREEPDGLRENFDADDLYPDVRTCFDALRAGGRRVIVAGNQPPQARAALEAMDLGADAILISDELGVEKPAPAFFAAVAEAAGTPPASIAYVGDRLDNDVLPARRAGMRTVLLRRGPWGYLHACRPEADLADIVTDTLVDLPVRLDALN
jgi:HAD superfamily hydrolase (TIGR01549 family)